MFPRPTGLRQLSLACTVAAIVVACRGSASRVAADAPPSSPPPALPDAAAPLPPEDAGAPVENPDVKRLELFIRSHADSVRGACLGHQKGAKPSSVSVTVTVSIDGRVTWAQASGTQKSVERCIEDHIRRWHFPLIAETLTVTAPFKFRQ